MKTQAKKKPSKGATGNRANGAKKNDGQSLKDKYGKFNGDLSYPDSIEELEDSAVREMILPKVQIPVGKSSKKMTCDSAASGLVSEYSGPIPLGFRTIPPSSFMSFKGPMGKAVKHFGARNFYLGDQVNAWFDQNCFVNKADSMPGEDAVAAGFKFSPVGKTDKKLVNALESLVFSDTFDIEDTMRLFDHHKRCFGAALMVPCFADDDVDMSMPLVDYSQLKGKTFIGWTVIEPYYLSPDFESGSRELTDPTYKFYMVPTHWNIYGATASTTTLTKRIHRSWAFFRRNVITSKIYQPMYKWQGPSIPQMILERLYSAEVCANESSMLLRSKRSFVIEGDIRKMIANPVWTKKFLMNCAANANNWGIRIVPQNSNAKQMDSYLSECMPLTTAQYGILCAEVDIPAPKFMMAQLTGFANSGNYEVKLYAQKEKNLQRNELEPIVRQTLRIATACDTGKPLDFKVEFGDVDVPTVTEKSEMLYEEARAAKFFAEAEAVRKMQNAKSAETHKSVIERGGEK